MTTDRDDRHGHEGFRNARPDAGQKPIRPPAETDARNRTQGYVVECDGERAVIAARTGHDINATLDYWAVGQLITVRVGENRVVGLVHAIDTIDGTWRQGGENNLRVRIELVGEIRNGANGSVSFSTGIVSYPHMGAIAHRIRAADLAAVYAASGEGTLPVGHLTQDRSIPALITVDRLLSRHFAVVGTTGVGKSTAVTLLLRKIVQIRKDIRVLLLDPHNEFTAAFPGQAITVNAATLDLPFWIFQLEEFVEVVFRGRPLIPEEVDALRDFIPLAREQYANEGSGSQTLLRRRRRENNAITADTPLPYRMLDLIKIIRDREGLLDGKADRPVLKSLRNRLEAIVNDSRFRFMFHTRTPGDSFEKTIGHIFRVPVNGRPICVFEMSGLPSEVVNAVVSVLSRLAFELAVSSNGAIPTLVVCEEAHRYIPSDPDAGFWPARAAIARIAKEGRKYGAYLAVVSQRPGELDPTILSQCNTIFSMRLGNERDKQIIEQAISGAARSTISFLSSLSNREAVAFGEAVPTPMRMMFETVEAAALPGSRFHEEQVDLRESPEDANLATIIRRMRKQDQPPIDYGEDFEKAPALSFVGDSPAPQARPLPVAPAAETEPARRHPVAPSSAGAEARAGGRPFGQPPAASPADDPHPSGPGAGPAVRTERANDLIRGFRSARG